MPPRMIGLYALATMEREGSVHGYALARRIAERTSGAWSPGPGAIYPSLRALVDRGLARRRGIGRRQEYRITPSGQAVLRRIRARARSGAAGAPDLGVLWAEVVGTKELAPFLLRRLRRSLDAISTALAQDRGAEGPRKSQRSLRDAAIAELTDRLAQLRGGAPRGRGAARSRRGARRA